MLRRLRFPGAEIAELLDKPLARTSRVLARIGMGKLGRLGLELALRYERQRPGESVHIDVKQLGRDLRRRGQAHHRFPAQTPTLAAAIATGSVARPRLGRRPCRVDDAARLTYAEVLSHEKVTIVGLPATDQRVLCPPQNHGRAGHHRQRGWLPLDDHALACRALGIRHLRTRPLPSADQRQGERLIQTMLAG